MGTIGDTVGLTTPGAKSRYVAAFARRGDPSKASQKAALDKVAERLRRRDNAQERLVNSVREALNLEIGQRTLLGSVTTSLPMDHVDDAPHMATAGLAQCRVPNVSPHTSIQPISGHRQRVEPPVASNPSRYRP